MAVSSKDDKDLLAVSQWAHEPSHGVVRRLVERVVQQVLEAEISQFLRAWPYERSPERRVRNANGFQRRPGSAPAGPPWGAQGLNRTDHVP